MLQSCGTLKGLPSTWQAIAHSGEARISPAITLIAQTIQDALSTEHATNLHQF